jgi:hypothetical protein
VAAANAYPMLLVLNTPGGGITPSLAAEVATAFRSIARFTDRLQGRDQAGSRSGLPWRDPDSGATVALAPLGGGPGDAEPPMTLGPALAAGPGADPEAGIEIRDPETLQREAAPLLDRFAASLEGLSEATVRTHVMNAEIFLEFLASTEAISLAAVSEYDLRVFLHDRYPRKVIAPLGEMRRMPVSLKRFFRFSAESLGLALPWAGEILDDRAGFEHRLATVPGPFGLDPGTRDWIGEVTVDLAIREFLPDDAMAGGGRWGD